MGFWNKLFGKKGNEFNKSDDHTSNQGANIIDIKSDNERMNWAIEKARLTINYFKQCLTNPTASQTYFSVKVKFEDNEMVEHIWLSDPQFDQDGNLFGTIGNEPRDVRTVKFGQKVGVENSKISDWMIFDKGVLIGGYTIRAIRDGLPDNQKSNFDKSLNGVIIDEGVDYFEPNRSTPEGAILAMENAYETNDLDAVLVFKNFDKEAEFMLAKLNTNATSELIESTSEVLKLSFIKWIAENGFPSFKEIKRAFPIRHKLTDNHYIITEICKYPDGSKSVQKLNTYKMPDGWVVLAHAE